MRAVCEKISELTLVMLLMTMLLAGCRTSKPQKSLPVTPSEKSEVQNMTFAERFDTIVGQYNDYNCFTAQFKLSVNAPQQISFSGRAYIERNKSIYLSLRKFGMEVARLYVTNDSLVAVDRFNKRYVAESLNDVLVHCPITIGNIQSLLTGQVFEPGDKKPRASHFDIDRQSENGQWIALPKDLPSGFEAGYVFSDEADRLLAFAVKSESTVFLTRYLDYVTSPVGSLAGDVDIRVQGIKIPLEITIDWIWNGSVWNKPSEMKQFVYPDRGYQRIAAGDLLKLLK
ncbi:MAG: DUF4292 domain-containing protein [Muribaculaceae bacterium]|nr:DUF4292 domain-containing protein [Muribaculaceae bacterium]